MNKLYEKRKVLFLISTICLALAFVTGLLSNGSAVLSTLGIGYGYNVFHSFGSTVMALVSLLTILLSCLISLCLVLAAFLQWRKDKNAMLLLISAVLQIAVIFLNIVNQVLSFLTYEYFNFAQLLGCLSFLPLVFAAYLILFSIIKTKGPVVPIIGLVLILLMTGSSLLSGCGAIITNIVSMFEYFHISMLWSVLRNIVSVLIGMVSNIGLLLLVPMAFYIPKEKAAVAEVPAEEAPVEEAPAAE